MNNLIAIIALCILFLPELSSQQANNYELVKSIPVKGKILSSDKLDHGYVVNNDNELFKIDPDGEIKYTYSNTSLGKISFVGTNNPLKLLVYYPDFATIVTLDNTLSQTSRINLYQLGTNQVSAACVALDNNIWIFDEVNFKLIKYDETFNILQESEDLNNLLGMNVRPVFMIEKDNFIYASDPEIGILVFDLYATYYKTIPLKELKSFQKIQDKLIYYKEGKLQSYQLKTFKEQTISLPADGEITDARIEKNRLFLLRKNKLDLYAY